MCGVLRIDFLKFYRSISGITGHPSENQKHLVLEFLIVCWMQKSVCEYLVPFQSESVKTSAGCSKKKVTLGNFFLEHPAEVLTLSLENGTRYSQTDFCIQ